jgi:short-subunit dehydrogenase
MKTILITGARSGIGRDSAVALAQKKYRVIATVHRDESIEELKAYAKDHNVDFEVFRLDITNLDDQKKIENFDLDVLINNAGIGESGSLADIPFARVRSNFETNVFGTLELTQKTLKRMLKKDSGRVIFISSIAGRITMPFWGSYNMTKFSLSAAADVLRQELRQITKNVFISVVEPGTYHTGFNQKVMSTKYEWLGEESYFFKIIHIIKSRETKMFNLLELKSTKSIVKQIVKAVEAKKPGLRYTTPWWQAFFVRILRILGK